MSETDAQTAEQNASHEPAAIWIDRFYLTILEERVRIGFGENSPGGPRYHAAVALSHANALALAELIQKFIQRVPTADAPASGGGGGLH